VTNLEIAVQLLGGPTNKVIYDDVGMPSIMVRFDKGKLSDVLTEGDNATHPAFIVNDTEIPAFWYSKFQNVQIGNRAYSLPLQDPRIGVNFDFAKTICEAKGAGWHLGTNAEWAWIALQCLKNGFLPRGNNNKGENSPCAYERGVATSTHAVNVKTATGSGPKSWAHNNDSSGVWDLDGNVNEWIGGFRLLDGEIHVLANNDAADANNSQAAASQSWKAILQDGSLVSPGTADTLKYDYVDGTPPIGTGSYNFRLNTTLANPLDNDQGLGEVYLKSLEAASGITVPTLLKALALFPGNSDIPGLNKIQMRNRGERSVVRGGYYIFTGGSGVFNFEAKYNRAIFLTRIGFRSAFIELPTT